MENTYIKNYQNKRKFFIDKFYKFFLILVILILGSVLFLSCGATSNTSATSNITTDNTPADTTPTDNNQPDDTTTTTETEESILAEKTEVSTQTSYQAESEGAPARPTWDDKFRHYPEIDFFKQGRYPLVWRKDPGTSGTLATRWELYQIIFNDPAAMTNSDKWGKTIDVSDVKSVSTIHSNNNLTDLSFSTTQDFDLPNDILPPVTGIPSSTSSVSSTAYAPITIPVNANTQVGYYAIFPTNSNNRNLVVAYKVRIYAETTVTTPDGGFSNVEKYNDSSVLMVNFSAGSFVQISAAGGNSGGTSGGTSSSELVADAITNLTQLRTALNFTGNQIFKSDWESRKLTGTAPVEELITEDDFDILFPTNIRSAFHDKNLTYYTWANFVEASRYFPKFLNEGTKETKYRELAAFLGNKSHETGDGWAGLGETRWSYGLVWIVELTALTGSGLSQQPTDQEDLYKAYLPGQYGNGDTDHATYPAVAGKSYHGRGPVQLSWNYNYGLMSETLFGDKNILLANPNLIARHGVLGWASAIWFWMQPQAPKPSAHDVMVGNVDFSEPYTTPTNIANRSTRSITSPSIGYMSDGITQVDYTKGGYRAPNGAEIGFGLTINIINGGIESSTGPDGRHARRITFFARYLDYFGTTKQGRDDGIAKPISPQVVAPAGDPVPQVTVDTFANWRNWIHTPADYDTTEPDKNFPTDITIMPSIITSAQASPF